MLDDASSVRRDRLEVAVASLRHRGPDGEGIWISPDGRVGLGHTRLSIIDLEGGAQPLANESGRIHAVVNGEIYEHDRILEELVRRGHAPRSRSDSECVIHLYEEFGVHCLKYLRGEFAFVLWDEDNQMLFAARDRFGIKPLQYASVNGALHLASEAKALFAAGVPARWDQEALYSFVRGVHDASRTLFDGVLNIPPGHYLVATRGHRRLQRYWDIDYPRDPSGDGGPDDQEAAALVRDALEEAVKLRLRADVEVGCYLSGGIDSSAILALAAKHHSSPVHAYTISFEDERFDEKAIAAETARLVGARIDVLDVTEGMLAQHFADSVRQSEMLAINSHGCAKYLLSRRVRERSNKVVLTGEGADEIFGGYLSLQADALLQASADAAALSDLAAKNHAMSVLVDPSVLGRLAPSADTEIVLRTLGYVPSWMELGAKSRRHEVFAPLPDHLRNRNLYATFLAGIDVDGRLAGRERVHQSMYLLARANLATYILTVLGDRAEMAHSIEGRVPFLDHRVVERVAALPARFKIRGSIEKFVLREAVRPFVTPTVYERKKHVFLGPAPRREGALFQLVNDELRSTTFSSVPLYDATKVRALLDRLPTMPDAEYASWSSPLFQMTSAAILQRSFGLV